MKFHATNFTVSVLLLMAATVFMMIVRLRKPIENNWPFIYWLAVTAATLTYPDLTFDFRIILVGLIAGLMLRFEFLNHAVTKLVMLVEMLVWFYILYASWSIITMS
jgi:hypothetical protein